MKVEAIFQYYTLKTEKAIFNTDDKAAIEKSIRKSFTDKNTDEDETNFILRSIEVLEPEVEFDESD